MSKPGTPAKGGAASARRPSKAPGPPTSRTPGRESVATARTTSARSRRTSDAGTEDSGAEGGDNIKVAVRVRPFNKREIKAGSKNIVMMDGPVTVISDPDPEVKADDQFTFDHSFFSFDENAKNFADQQHVYDCLGKGCLDNAWQGYNSSIFAYGQTGSGKSYSMMGEPSNAGVIPQFCNELFERVTAGKEAGDTFVVEVSYLEIYNERIKDLLNPPSEEEMKRNPNKLKVRESPEFGIYVQGLSKNLIASFADVQNFLDMGNKVRTVGATLMNDVSSRSHAVLTIYMSHETTENGDKTTRQVKINLVDLAGSERQKQTKSEGKRLQEAVHINKSLSALSAVISALSEKAQGGAKKETRHIPYRDSVLTRLLQESLGGNAKAVMIAAISPADINHNETVSTLKYAARAKKIKNKPKINSTTDLIIQALREEVERLKQLLKEAQEGNNGFATPHMRHQLEDDVEGNEDLIHNLSIGYEERERVSHALQVHREQYLKTQGISMNEVGVTAEDDAALPRLVNLNPDNSLSQTIVYFLHPGPTTCGTSKRVPPPNIVLAGRKIEDDHCAFFNEGGAVYIEPVAGHGASGVGSASTVFDHIWTHDLKPLSVWRPKLPEGFVRFGDVLHTSSVMPTHRVLIAKDDRSNFVRPSSFRLVADHLGEISEPLFLWLPEGPEGFVALGVTGTTTRDPPDPNSVRMVSEELTEECDPIFVEEEDGFCVWHVGALSPTQPVSTFLVNQDHDRYLDACYRLAGSYPQLETVTFVNGQLVTRRTRLAHGNRVIIGRSYVFRFVHPEEAAEAARKRTDAGLPAEDTFDWEDAIWELSKAMGIAVGSPTDPSAERLRQAVMMCDEANDMAQALRRKAVFAVDLAGFNNESISIRSTSLITDKSTIISLEQFQNRLEAMVELHANGGKLQAGEDDPFYDPPDDVLLGTALLPLESVSRLEPTPEIEIVIHGKNSAGESIEAGRMLVTVKVYTEQCTEIGPGVAMSSLFGRKLPLCLHIKYICGLRDRPSGVFVTYDFPEGGGEEATMRVNESSGGVFHVEHKALDYLAFTPAFVRYLTTKVVKFQVFGRMYQFEETNNEMEAQNLNLAHLVATLEKEKSELIREKRQLEADKTRLESERSMTASASQVAVQASRPDLNDAALMRKQIEELKKQNAQMLAHIRNLETAGSYSYSDDGGDGRAGPLDPRTPAQIRDNIPLPKPTELPREKPDVPTLRTGAVKGPGTPAGARGTQRSNRSSSNRSAADGRGSNRSAMERQPSAGQAASVRMESRTSLSAGSDGDADAGADAAGDAADQETKKDKKNKKAKDKKKKKKKEKDSDDEVINSDNDEEWKKELEAKKAAENKAPDKKAAETQASPPPSVVDRYVAAASGTPAAAGSKQQAGSAQNSRACTIL